MKTYTLEGIIQKTILIEVPGYSLRVEAGQEVAIFVVISEGQDEEMRCDCWKVCPDGGCEGWAVHKTRGSILHDCGRGHCNAVDQDAQCIPVEPESEVKQE